MAESDFWDKIYAKIKYLRAQPESAKVRYVWISSMFVLLIIILLWIGIFQKYENRGIDGGKNSELIEAGKKLKNDIENKIKVPDIDLPSKETPSISPEASPAVSPE